MSKYYNSNTRNMAYSSSKEFVAMQHSNALAQIKQDHGRVLGRNNNSELHVGRETRGGKVMGGLSHNTKQLKKIILKRKN